MDPSLVQTLGQSREVVVGVEAKVEVLSHQLCLNRGII